MTTTNIRAKIDELAGAIRLLRDKVSIIAETGNDDQYIAAVNTGNLLRNGLRSLEDLAVVVEIAEELLET